MNSLSKKPYKGCRDFFPKEKREQDFLFKKMHQTAKLFSYEHYDGPLLELVDLYLAKSGEELITEQIYSFTDRGERKVAIRPEMTPTVARMVAQVHRETPKPIRWYSIPNLMRYEKPQKGRLREHWQFNCDIFGAPEGLGEFEILALIHSLLSGFGATSEHFEILLNDRDIVNCVFDNILKTDEQTTYKLYKVIDKSKKVSPEKLSIMIDEFLSGEKKDILLEYLSANSFDSIKTFLNKYQQIESVSKFLNFVSLIEKTPLKDFIVYDPSIVRGLDYYTGIVFEVFDKHPDNKRAICGGGAYENLLKIFNEQPVAGVGFGLGDVTLTDFLFSHGLMPDLSKSEPTLMLCFIEDENSLHALNAATKLRSIGIDTEVLLQKVKPKKLFQLAQKKGAKFVAFVENEKVLKIKNMQERVEAEFTISQTEQILEFING